MPQLIQLIRVSYHLAEHTILSNLNLKIFDQDIVGIVGSNGAGKSTLLNLLSRSIQPTEGSITTHPNLTSYFFEQEVKNYQATNETLRRKQLLASLGVPSTDYERLSGGEQLKYRLADAFSEEVDVLFLDEPTNHLDEYGIELLIKEIQRFKGSVVIVSHDRYFLNKVVTKIWSIANGKVVEYPGNYSSYVEQHDIKKATHLRQINKQQKKIKEVTKQVNDLSSWSDKAHKQSTKHEGYKEHYRKKAKQMDRAIKSKQKRLAQYLEQSKVEPLPPEIEVLFDFSTNQTTGRRFVEVKDLTLIVKHRTIFQGVNFTIQHGERIALVGPNGCGKTSLLEVIMGNKQAIGKVWVSDAAHIGYLTQTIFDLPLNHTPEEFFSPETYGERAQIQQALNQLGFKRHQWREPIRDMSMGERVKLKLMAFILEGKDVLILDEPTNHLDLLSREQLERTLLHYRGTLIVVSHDRYFREKVTDTQLECQNQRIIKVESHNEKAHVDIDILTLETRREAVLAKLSVLTKADPEYVKLDADYISLSKSIRKLKHE